MTKTLQELIGLHTLTGVDYGQREVTKYGDVTETVNALYLEIDGFTLAFVEDPSDGYRSTLDEILEIPSSEYCFTTRFQPTQVLCAWDKGNYGDDNVVVFIDTTTGKAVVRAGTSNAHDYYPCYMAEYNPESLCWNQSIV